MQKLTLLILSITLTTILSGCGQPKPQDYAEATAIVQRSSDDAALAEVQRAQEWVAVDAAKRAAPAATLRDSLVYLGIGLGLLVLLVGSALAVAAWLYKQAATIYPNAAGQYPLVVQRNFLSGETMIHDPSRMVGPSAVYSSQTKVRRWLREEPTSVHMPQTTDDSTQLQITTQTQAAALLVAATRNGVLPALRPLADSAVRSAFANPSLPRLPTIEVLEAPDDLARVDVRRIERALLAAGGSDASVVQTDADEER